MLADFEFEPSDGIIPDNRRTKDVWSALPGRQERIMICFGVHGVTGIGKKWKLLLNHCDYSISLKMRT